MDEWTEIRRKVLVEGASKRSIRRDYKIGSAVLDKILANSEPPGYRTAAGRAKVTKRYDTATTPHERALARTSTTKRSRSEMTAVMAKIRPADLYRRIQDLTGQLELLALSKAPAPVKPRVNRAFNQ